MRYGAYVTPRSLLDLVLSLGNRNRKTKKVSLKFKTLSGFPPYQLKVKYNLETLKKIKEELDSIPSVEEILMKAMKDYLNQDINNPR
jgi:hypothetical protein